MATKNIVKTVTETKETGRRVFKYPDSYYDDLLDRVGHIDEELKPLKDWAFWWIATKKDIFCKFSPNRSRIADVIL